LAANQKILILKPSSLGDVVQALPVLRMLKRHWPQSEIHWWIDSHLAPLLADDPDLAGLILFERRRWSSPRYWPEVLQSVHRTRTEAFDCVIDLQGLARSAIFAWLANAPLTIGLESTREGARGFYDLVVPRPSYDTHAVDWYVRVLPRLGVPVNWDINWLPDQPKVTAELRRKWPMDGARWVVLQPGARWLNKRWPVEHFSELTRRLAASNPDLRFAILGSGDDQPLGEAISRAAAGRCLDLTGKLSLPEMVAWIRWCEVMVTNDTGPMHVAAGLGKPVAALFGPTDPRRTGPYGQLENVLRLQLECVPCMKSSCAYAKPLECLRALTPETVFAAVRKHLESPRSSTA
jgi:lipopolysaccharide heptosyltransferase II